MKFCYENNGLGKLGMAALIALLSLGCSPAPEKNCGYMHNPFNENILWRNGSAVKLIVPEQYIEPAKNAAATWNDAVGRELIKIEAGPTYFPQTRDGFMGVYFNTTLGFREQGRTTVYSMGDAITEVDILVSKDFNYYWNIPGTIAMTGYINLEALLLHEMGHALGLGHRASGVMAPYLAANSDRIILTNEDKFAIVCGYGRSERKSTYGNNINN